MQVCYYRDKQSINKFKLATVTASGVKITEPFALETEWGYKVSSCTRRNVRLQHDTEILLADYELTQTYACGLLR